MKSNLPEDNEDDSAIKATSPSEVIALFGKLSEFCMAKAVTIFCKSHDLQKEDAVRLLMAIRGMESPECMALLMTHKKQVGEMCHALISDMTKAIKSAPADSAGVQMHIDGDGLVDEMVVPMVKCLVKDKDKFIPIATGEAPPPSPEFKQRVEDIMKSVALEVISKCKANPEVAKANSLLGGPGMEKMNELEAHLKSEGVQPPSKEMLRDIGLEDGDGHLPNPPADPSNN